MYNFLKENTINEEDIFPVLAGIEEKYGVSIPNILREYYMKYNGCKIKLCHFFVNGYECEVSKIIPIKSSGLSFEKIVDNDRIDGFIDQNLYPLASNRGGDYYYWNAQTETVYLLLSDDIENPFKICDSISEFFDLLDNSK